MEHCPPSGKTGLLRNVPESLVVCRSGPFLCVGFFRITDFTNSDLLYFSVVFLLSFPSVSPLIKTGKVPFGTFALLIFGEHLLSVFLGVGRAGPGRPPMFHVEVGPAYLYVGTQPTFKNDAHLSACVAHHAAHEMIASVVQNHCASMFQCELSR